MRPWQSVATIGKAGDQVAGKGSDSVQKLSSDSQLPTSSFPFPFTYSFQLGGHLDPGYFAIVWLTSPPAFTLARGVISGMLSLYEMDGEHPTMAGTTGRDPAAYSLGTHSAPGGLVHGLRAGTG